MTTKEHPFYVQTKGWISADELEIGDLLASHTIVVGVVESKQSTGKVETVYNFRVADFHTYFVGCEEWGFSVWAHNADYAVVHHIGPDGKNIYYLRDINSQVI